MLTREDLRKQLMRIDGKGYRAYRDIQEVYDYVFCTLFIDHVQSDPFASPSRVRVEIKMGKTGMPADLWDSSVKRVEVALYSVRILE